MQELFVKNGDLDLCIQTFGIKTNPAIILISGASGQAILWNKTFCQNLAQAGYFVIRFDNRDTGKSSGINYAENPYNLQDMAKDVISILNQMNIDKAHIVGMSMGGYIAQVLAIHHPERIISLTLIMTTINSMALRGIRGISNLPGQSAAIVHKIANMYQTPRLTLEDRIKSLTDIWQLFNGNDSPFPYDEWYYLAEESYKRAISKNAVRNHRLAILNSSADRTELLKDLSIPTLIIHGKADPIIHVEHAYYANQCLPSTKLLVIDKMGHMLTSIFIEQIAEELLKHFESNIK